MIKKTFIILFFWFSLSLSAQITLTHNVGNVPIDTGMPNCQYEEYWARSFVLSDFGISTAEQFIIESGQVAIRNSYKGARMIFNIYAIDSNFPNSSPKVISYGNYVEAPAIGNTPEIVQINFGTSIVVPRSVERILVEVFQDEDTYNPDYAKVSIAGTEQDNDVSWFSGCREYYTHTSTADLDMPVPNANFYINITGKAFNNTNTGSNTTLTHNLSDPPIKVNQYACTGGGLKFARTFNLKDFGISMNEEFIINTGQVAFSSVGVWDVKIQFNIYKIDANFPDSFSSSELLGSSQIVDIPYIGSGNIPRIFKIDFENPVVIPENIDRILVEVYNLPRPGYSSTAFIAGSVESNGLSWLKSEAGGCPPECYTSTIDLGRPEVNYYLNVTGDVNPGINSFGMSVTGICSEFLKEFRVEPKSNIASILWNFGDPASGANNTSTDLSPFHDFSADGNFNITATIIANDGSIEALTETIDVREPPTAHGISNVYSCEDSFNTGFSTSFDISAIEQQVLNGQTDKIITYFDGFGNKYYALPNPFSNTIRDRETITVRVANKDNRCCYSETTFDLIVNLLPDISSVEDVYVCDNDYDGIGFFDLTVMQRDILSHGGNLEAMFFHEDGEMILDGSLSSVQNKVVDIEQIKVLVTNLDTYCTNETIFSVLVDFKPIAFDLPDLIGCDEDGDGISEYFDISNVEFTILGNQSGMEVSYFDSVGNAIYPVNTYTNTMPFEEALTVRLTHPFTQCFAETKLILKTSRKPQINQPQEIYACNEGNGFGSFDLSTVENEIIGVQDNLSVYYYDVSGNNITNSINSSFNNTEAWNQTIYVKIENASSSLCVSETNFKLIVNELPQLELEEEYFLCDLEPNLLLSLNEQFDSWEWTYKDATVLSNTNEVYLVNAGDYQLRIGKLENGILCEKNFNFKLIRSILPSIQDIEYRELSDNNFIEIIVTGDGDFEYSINDINYQDSNRFNNVLGGVYNVTVRDKLGCGEDSKEVVLIDYPKYFTPNYDGINDTWHVKGIKDYPNVIILIYDRYGKLLKQISPNSIGWDGTFNGKRMLSSDYWFTVDLDGEKSFTGHFSLKR